ncbi:transposase domain-containing protein, partial [Thiolapillus sp.]
MTDYTAKKPVSSEADPAVVIQSLQSALEASRSEIAALKHQPDWFKRQLFGRKSEKRIIEHPDQLDLSALLGDAASPSEPEA